MKSVSKKLDDYIQDHTDMIFENIKEIIREWYSADIPIQNLMQRISAFQYDIDSKE
jgi:acyl carrier protein